MNHMWVVLIVAIFGYFASALEPQHDFVNSDIEPFLFEEQINETINKIRDDIPDPINIESLSITLPDSVAAILAGSINVSNFQLSGVKSFQVPALSLNIFGLQLNFTLGFPSINLNTDYEADMVLASLLPLYGHGTSNINIIGAEIKGSATANITDGLSIHDLRIQLYVKSASFVLHGALDNEDFSALLSQMLNDLVAEFIDNHQDVISNILSPILESIVNSILSQTPTTDAPSDI